jgi:DNA-binding response OmpR family regulator
VRESTLFAKIDLALRSRWSIIAAQREQLEQLAAPSRNRRGDSPALLIATWDVVTDLPSIRRIAPLLLICDTSEIRVLAADDCDDVLVAPWSTAELRYRVSRMTPRRRALIDGVRVEWDRHVMTIHSDGASATVALSSKQYLILDTLLRNTRPVSREVLCRMASIPPGRSFDMHQSRIRSKLASLEERLGIRLQVRGDRNGGFFLAASKSSIP